jgi:hypothetical protein
LKRLGDRSLSAPIALTSSGLFQTPLCEHFPPARPTCLALTPAGNLPPPSATSPCRKTQAPSLHRLGTPSSRFLIYSSQIGFRALLARAASARRPSSRSRRLNTDTFVFRGRQAPSSFARLAPIRTLRFGVFVVAGNTTSRSPNQHARPSIRATRPSSRLFTCN